MWESKQQHDEDDLAHNNDVMADTGPNIQPTPIVPHQEEKMLEEINISLKINVST